MAISDKVRVIQQVQSFIQKLIPKYRDSLTHDELTKLSQSLLKLEKYLNHLDELKPDYKTNDINEYMEAIDLHVTLLHTKLESSDLKKLQKGMRGIKTILKFHPIKHSYLEFIFAWIFEFVYFI